MVVILGGGECVEGGGGVEGGGESLPLGAGEAFASSISASCCCLQRSDLAFLAL